MIVTKEDERIAAMTGDDAGRQEKVEKAVSEARAGLLAAIPTPEEIEELKPSMLLHEFHSANRRQIAATRDVLIAETHGGVADEDWRLERDVRDPAALAAEAAANQAFGLRIRREHDLLVSHLKSGLLVSTHENDALDEEYGKARKAVAGESRILAGRLARVEAAMGVLT